MSCGRLGCWGVNIKDEIWFRHGVTPNKCEGESWEKIYGKLRQLEVCGDLKLKVIASSIYFGGKIKILWSIIYIVNNR